jgi:hypothetical protein
MHEFADDVLGDEPCCACDDDGWVGRHGVSRTP